MNKGIDPRSIILCGDCEKVLKTIEPQTIQTCVTSPPYYGLRDYGVDGQIGLEQTPEEYVDRLIRVFRQVWRVLRDDGTLWLNLGDSYNGSGKGGNPEGSPFTKQKTNHGSLLDRPTRINGLKSKDLIGIPWMVAFALRADGWYLRSEIIWHKPNPMPESVKDRPTKAHEQIFLFSKSKQYFYDAEAIKEPFISSQKEIERQWSGGSKETAYATSKNYGGGVGYGKNGRNRRDVWTVTTKSYKGAHFATFPPDLIEPCILAGSRKGDTVLDPFNGAGTTGMVALKHGREYIGIELNPEYIELSKKRLGKTAGA